MASTAGTGSATDSTYTTSPTHNDHMKSSSPKNWYNGTVYRVYIVQSKSTAHNYRVCKMGILSDPYTLMQLRNTREAGSPDPVAMTIPGLSNNFTCLSNCISCRDL